MIIIIGIPEHAYNVHEPTDVISPHNSACPCQ